MEQHGLCERRLKQDVWKAGRCVLQSAPSHLKPLFVGLSDCKLDPSPLRGALSENSLLWCAGVKLVRDNSWKSVWKAWDPVVRPLMSQHTSYTRGWRTHDFHAESIIGYIRPNNALLIMTVQMVCLGCMWMASSIP